MPCCFPAPVRDFSKAQVTLAPAEYASWGDARSEMMVEMKRPLKAQLQAELGAAGSEDAREEIQAAFAAREKALEHDLDHKPMDVHLTLDMAYNVREPQLDTASGHPLPSQHATHPTACAICLFAVPQQVGQALSVLHEASRRRALTPKSSLASAATRGTKKRKKLSAQLRHCSGT